MSQSRFKYFRANDFYYIALSKANVGLEIVEID